MRFWDSSALLPLFVNEAGTDRARRRLAEDPVVIVWALTRVELCSALARRRRERPDAEVAVGKARHEVLRASKRWAEIADIDVVRHNAERLVESYPLRAADALQLGAALVAAAGRPADLEFVTLDERQAAAAAGEGFPVLGPR